MTNQLEKGGVHESRERPHNTIDRHVKAADGPVTNNQTTGVKDEERVDRHQHGSLAGGHSGDPDTEELMLLPRIGPSVAQRIVEFRDKNGRFKATEDLLLVRGVGEKTFELIEPHVAVSGETTLTEKVTVPKQQPETP